MCCDSDSRAAAGEGCCVEVEGFKTKRCHDRNLELIESCEVAFSDKVICNVGKSPNWH